MCLLQLIHTKSMLYIQTVYFNLLLVYSLLDMKSKSIQVFIHKKCSLEFIYSFIVNITGVL